MERVKEAMLSALGKVDSLKIEGAPRIMVYFFVFIVAACLILFLSAWCVEWYREGTADMPIMIQFVNSVTSVSFVAAVGFFGRAMIDKDGDDVPDEFQKEGRTHR